VAGRRATADDEDVDDVDDEGADGGDVVVDGRVVVDEVVVVAEAAVDADTPELVPAVPQPALRARSAAPIQSLACTDRHLAALKSPPQRRPTGGAG